MTGVRTVAHLEHKGGIRLRRKILSRNLKRGRRLGLRPVNWGVPIGMRSGGVPGGHFWGAKSGPQIAPPLGGRNFRNHLRGPGGAPKTAQVVPTKKVTLFEAYVLQLELSLDAQKVACVTIFSRRAERGRSGCTSNGGFLRAHFTHRVEDVGV